MIAHSRLTKARTTKKASNNYNTYFFPFALDPDDPRLELPDSLSTRDRSASEQISTGRSEAMACGVHVWVK